jgi:hypothetical protein
VDIEAGTPGGRENGLHGALSTWKIHYQPFIGGRNRGAKSGASRPMRRRPWRPGRPSGSRHPGRPRSPRVEIGSLCQDPSVPANLLADELFSKHFAIVGTTGRGKSSALACILHRALERHQHAHVIVPDMDRPRLEETVSRWRGNAARKA